MTKYMTEREWLTSIGFKEISPDTFQKNLTKTVNTASHGEMDTTLTIIIAFCASGAINANIIKDSRTLKRKTYSFGWSRAFNAIRETVENAGFNLRNNDNPKCTRERDHNCEKCTSYTYSDKTGSRVWCYGKVEEAAS